MSKSDSGAPFGEQGALDVHAAAIASGLEAMAGVVADLDADNPVDDLDARIRTTTTRMVNLMAGLNPLVAIEQTRLRALPWHHGQPTYQAGIDSSFSCVELVAIVAMTARASSEESTTAPASIAEELIERAEELRRLGSLRAIASIDPTDPLGWIGATLQISEISMRGSSYSELLEDTTHSLFGDASTDSQLREAVGFGAGDALTVLSGLHELQVGNMNRRQQLAATTHDRVTRNHALGLATDQAIADATHALNRAFQPDEIAASVAASDLCRLTRLSETTVTAVLDAFTWRPDPGRTADEAVLLFLRGDNPLRVMPVLRTESGRALLVHPALTQAAVRERLEAILRTTAGWEEYQAHRGRLLERRTREAFEKLFPAERAWHAFLYYVPANDDERAAGPDSYTKRVEGDHLLVAGDVAIVIEDKAVALSSQSRSASPFRLRKDLTGIVTKAADQVQRLVARLRDDQGIRVHGEGWVDLTSVREIHTVAVSLEDLTSTSTATAELVKAGLLSAGAIPWTVSIHDLDLIAELAEHPAVFLLYLRRRRHPEATVYFTAPDELDLYLYFLESGLYVEEHPDRLRESFSFLPPAQPSDVRRWEAQSPAIITSRTDVLDAWYFEDHLRVRNGKTRLPSAPGRPQMAPTPLAPLISEITTSGLATAPSIIATLRSGDMKAQRRMAQHSRDVCLGSSGGTKERTITVPIATLDDGGWLLVWGTCPTDHDRARWERARRAYLRAKGHQLGVSRAVMFALDGESWETIGVFYEQIPAELSTVDAAVATHLQPLSAIDTVESARKQIRGQRTQPRGKRKPKKPR
ncbi:hypothetical protein [Microbacterium oxydans]|uniref:hypothetical protein n=1 Tax=Microbacterium oxydans TaxID=82380 RepID=UPI0024ADD68F|nr:hypothetical protein [Microbacterium oxydans]